MAAHPSKSRAQKRKRNPEKQTQDAGYVETTKPSAIFHAPGRGRQHTLSLALPGSVIANAQSHDLKTALVGRVARAAAVFCVDEIVVFDDGQSRKQPSEHPQRRKEANERLSYGESHSLEDGEEYTGWSDPDHFLCHLLSYLECPPFLRKKLFPMHPNLRTAGALPSLDMPHHLKPDEWSEYREGTTIDDPPSQDATNGPRKKQKHLADQVASTVKAVDAGIPNRIRVVEPIPLHTRVTVKLPKIPPLPGKVLEAEVVAPTDPREQSGIYWGFSVRRCASLSSVFTECPFEGGYDVSIGTSERGHTLEQVLPSPPAQLSSGTNGSTDKSTPQRLPSRFSHLLLVFGGVAGIETAASADKALIEQGIQPSNVSQVFDGWVNVCPGQGSRTIRTEEAIWLGLGALKPYVDSCGCSVDENN